MARKATKPKKEKSIEDALWDSCNKQRGSIEPSEYKHVVLSLIFLKYAGDHFEQKHQQIIDQYGKDYADMEQFFEDIMFLTEFYGCEVFVKKTNPLQDMGVFEIFQLEVKKRDIKARIQYFPQSNKYILMEGSTISAIESSCSKRAKEIRKLLIENPEYTKREGNVIKILQNTNIPVESGKPSTPASVITGTSMQGTTAFKNKDGKTFADLYQKNA